MAKSTSSSPFSYVKDRVLLPERFQDEDGAPLQGKELNAKLIAVREAITGKKVQYNQEVANDSSYNNPAAIAEIEEMEQDIKDAWKYQDSKKNPVTRAWRKFREDKPIIGGMKDRPGVDKELPWKQGGMNPVEKRPMVRKGAKVLLVATVFNVGSFVANPVGSVKGWLGTGGDKPPAATSVEEQRVQDGQFSGDQSVCTQDLTDELAPDVVEETVRRAAEVARNNGETQISLDELKGWLAAGITGVSKEQPGKVGQCTTLRATSEDLLEDQYPDGLTLDSSEVISTTTQANVPGTSTTTIAAGPETTLPSTTTTAQEAEAGTLDLECTSAGVVKQIPDGYEELFQDAGVYAGARLTQEQLRGFQLSDGTQVVPDSSRCLGR